MATAAARKWMAAAAAAHARSQADGDDAQPPRPFVLRAPRRRWAPLAGRIAPLHPCGLNCGDLRARGAGLSSGFAAKPALLASLTAACIGFIIFSDVLDMPVLVLVAGSWDPAASVAREAVSAPCSS